MKTCRNCGGTEIRSRVNYPHGKKSKSTVTFTCKNCCSTDIDSRLENRRYKSKRR